jgi:hypothetical protein
MIQYFKSNPTNPDSVYIKYDVTDNTSGIVSTVAQRKFSFPESGSTPPITQITFQVVSGSIYDNPPNGPLMTMLIAKVTASNFLEFFSTSSQEEYDIFINSTFELYKTY